MKLAVALFVVLLVSLPAADLAPQWLQDRQTRDLIYLCSSDGVLCFNAAETTVRIRLGQPRAGCISVPRSLCDSHIPAKLRSRSD